MKAVCYEHYGSPDKLKLCEIERPSPGASEILVKVMAASVNSWDWDKLTGSFQGRLPNAPFKPSHPVLGADIAGIVESVGPEVTEFSPGDAVLGDLSEDGWGGFAEFAVGDQKHFTIKPDEMPFTGAACVPQAGLLALQGLRLRGGVKAGDKVLINGAGGGVGAFAIQIAKALGADQVTAVDTTEKADLMLEMGADHVIDYKSQDFCQLDERYDYVLDALATRSTRKHLSVLKPGGTYVLAGGHTKTIFGNLLLGRLLGRRENKCALLLLWRPLATDMAELAAMAVSEKFKIPIDQIYPLERTGEALARLGAGQVKGKVVINPTL